MLGADCRSPGVPVPEVCSVGDTSELGRWWPWTEIDDIEESENLSVSGP